MKRVNVIGLAWIVVKDWAKKGVSGAKIRWSEGQAEGMMRA